ncbi:MAG: N-6 DNA methylase, partial [Bacteroidetes bacterium]|nr:N-6 DNA methylase [Bacteroidota bacterium]
MRNKKISGSYYTPKILAEFLVDYLSGKLKDKTCVSVLEPSAGDGIFVKTIFNHETFSKKIQNVVAIEKSKRELNKITKEIKAKSFTPIHNDFLEFQLNNAQKFSLVLGNPP